MREKVGMGATTTTTTKKKKKKKKKGCVRIEVPFAGNVSALSWLKANLKKEDQREQQHVSMYFSPRMSSAPDTAGSVAAEAAFVGQSAVAGIGWAWRWKGKDGRQIDGEVMEDMRTFLDAAAGGSSGGGGGVNRIRVFGGGKFDPGNAMEDSWKPFGSFYLLLPRCDTRLG